MNSLVSLNSVSKEFTHGSTTLPVLEAISFSVKEGEIVSILGKSGVGKTTLLNIIAGVESPTSGLVSVQGRMSYVPQQDLLLPWRSVIKNVLLPLEIRNKNTTENEAKASELLRKMGIENFKETFPNQLSGGMRQKASLVRGIVNDPEIYLFDESFSAIDYYSRLKIQYELRNEILSKNRAAIFVTHNIEEGIAMGDRIVILEGIPARIVYDSEFTIDENLRDPIEIRKTTEFQKQFESVWKIISKTI